MCEERVLRLRQVAELSESLTSCAVLSRYGLTEDFDVTPAGWQHWTSRWVVKVSRVYGFPRVGYYDDVDSLESGGWSMDHPIIKQFEAHAELLNISGSVEAIDEAIVQLATWMDGLELSEDDQALLCHIGAVLYREGLRVRMGMRP